MDFFGLILWPIKWVIEAILVGFHTLFTVLGLQSEAGLTWVLSIAGLVVVVRAALIPLFVRQIKSQRKMLEIAPDLKKIQDKYKGKRDQFSREAMSRETMALYGKHKTSPFASCLPILVQMPIFFGLFSVLNNSFQGLTGVGLLNEQLSLEFGRATLFGIAPLIIIAANLIMGVLALGVATLRRGVNPIAYVTQAVLLLPVATEPMWFFAWLICIIFWVSCLVKGLQLDRRKGQQ